MFLKLVLIGLVSGKKIGVISIFLFFCLSEICPAVRTSREGRKGRRKETTRKTKT
jgi:hypothetical protein